MLKRLLDPQVSAVIALFAYGAWAAFSNRAHGQAAITTAFFIQGAFAFVATLTMGKAALYLYQKTGKSLRALGFSFACCFIILCVVPSALHWALGTPEIFLSIIPGLIWGSLYLAALLLLKHKEQQP